ncbi:MAG TPA: hypothetical protein ENH85_03190, partial [Candidatus Scalindua sp.]|nr:hypothetical protein [Candidatus Scalindua sp.]
MPATNWFRKNQRKLLGVLVVFLMVIWGIGPAVDYIVPKPPVGEILGEKISQEEFSDTVVRWARVFFRDSKEPVAEQVWKQLALVHQAERMGILVTDEELVQEIQSWFPVGPVIFTNREEYRRLLGSIFHMTQYQFEKNPRPSDHCITKLFLRDFLTKYFPNRRLRYYIINCWADSP